MNASVDRGIDKDGVGVLLYDSESGMEVRESTRRQRATASHKLDERL